MKAIEKKLIARVRSGAYSSRELAELICEASAKGWLAVVRELVDLGVDPNGRRHGLSALTLASQMGRDHLEVLQLLLNAGADPHDPDAIVKCGVQSLPILLAAGAEIDGENGGDSPLLVAIVQRTKQDKALALIESGANPNIADKAGKTALMYAAAKGRDRVFDALLNAGADLYSVDVTGRTALRYALETLCSATAATDMVKRAAKRIVGKIRDELPAQPEDVVLLDIVLGEHVSLSYRLKQGLDANLTISGSIGFLGISLDTVCEKLEELGGTASVLDVLSIVSPSSADSIAGGSTLLMWAVASRQHKCIETLLAYGADPERMNADGVSAFTLSNSPGFDSQTRKLIRDAMEST